jgi:hypothetical protein
LERANTKDWGEVARTREEPIMYLRDMKKLDREKWVTYWTKMTNDHRTSTHFCPNDFRNTRVTGQLAALPTMSERSDPMQDTSNMLMTDIEIFRRCGQEYIDLPQPKTPTIAMAQTFWNFEVGPKYENNVSTDQSAIGRMIMTTRLSLSTYKTTVTQEYSDSQDGC